MGVVQWILKRLAAHFGMKAAYEKINASFKLGEPTDIQFPKEAVATSINFASSGLLNMFAIQCNLDWVMPFWVNRQYDPESNSYVPGNVLSTNLTHRNWTAIGGVNSEREPIVDPAGLVTPWFDGWSIEYWVGKNNYLIVPARNTEVYQYLVKQLPLVVSQFIKKDVRIRSEAFVADAEQEILCDSISIENLESVPVTLSLFASIRPYNPEGISPLYNIEYNKEKNLFLIAGNTALVLKAKPSRVYCSNWEDGDCSFKAFSPDIRHKISCKKGLATAMAEYKITLKPGQVREMNVRALTKAKKSASFDVRVIRKPSYQNLRSHTIEEWDNIVKRGTDLKLPYQKMQNAFMAGKAHLYLFIDKNVITPGPFLYHHEYFRDAAYSLLALDKLGYHEEAERILLHYPHRQRADGYFLSQEGEWDANGEALWSYYQHYLFTRDKEFAERIIDSAYRGFKWIKRMRSKTTGLLPAGYSAEHFGPSDTFYWDNFWALAGIRGFAFLARELKKQKMAETAEKLYKEYYKAVFISIDKTQKKFGFSVIPSSPHRSLDSSIIGSICALYPLRLIQPKDLRMTGTLRTIREKYQQNWAFFHRVIHSGYNVYLTAQLAECYLFRRSSRVLPITQWIMDNISRTATFPEAIHPVTGGGCMGDGHHAWACADLINLLRNLIFFEEQDKLVITPIIYHRWFEPGETIMCANAPSRFGTLNITIQGHPEKVLLSLDCEYHTPPRAIEFSVPFAVSKVYADGKKLTPTVRSTVILPAGAHQVEVYR
jgi:GH15 family glucan-1,4-alpha-glucosidase